MMENDGKKVFLLGGHDLEMMTIKELLQSRDDCVVDDKNLCWENAWLTAYWYELLVYAQCEIYGIELMDNLELHGDMKKNYHRIDHHNNYSSLPSSLEQVAAVLGVELNRWQRLVAANDSGYIPAMEALGATNEEVAAIRLADRAAQGVTEEDERLAEKSIEDNLLKLKNIWIVKSQTKRFSAICDRLYPCQRLLIYTDREWMFYGDGKSELVSALERDIRLGKVFYGGGDSGYVGCVEMAYRKEEIEQIIEQIKKRYDA